jgi:hypothetical protein
MDKNHITVEELKNLWLRIHGQPVHDDGQFLLWIEMQGGAYATGGEQPDSRWRATLN